MARRHILFLFLCAALWSVASARADDHLGETVVINKLDDLNFGSWSGTGNITRVSRHCVASTASGNLFSITLTGNGPGGSFTLASGPGSLPYRVWYRDRPGQAWQEASPGVTIFNLVGRNNPNNCRGQRQRVRVRFMANDLAAATAGTYSGTLTLLVAPM